MKRYLIFSGYSYYAAPGMKDFRGDFEEIPSIEFEKNYIKINGEKLFNSWESQGKIDIMYLEGQFSWLQIYDCQERKIIEEYGFCHG
jgi:predicted ester cyclase